MSSLYRPGRHQVRSVAPKHSHWPVVYPSGFCVHWATWFTEKDMVARQCDRPREADCIIVQTRKCVSRHPNDVVGFEYSVYLAAAFFFAAQRFLAAAAMRAHPSGERTRFFFCGEAIGELAVTLGGRPAFRLATVTADPAARRARACLSVAISASIVERMSVSAMQEL